MQLLFLFEKERVKKIADALERYKRGENVKGLRMTYKPPRRKVRHI